MAMPSHDVSPQFRAWACSLSGCDGGNPNAPLYLCGIEWGLGKESVNTG